MMIDAVIKQRNGVGDCNKVTLVTHSSGANSALVLASTLNDQTSRKVNRIVTLAPCLRVNLDNFFSPLREVSPIESFY